METSSTNKLRKVCPQCSELYMSGERFVDVAMPFQVSVDHGLTMCCKQRNEIDCTKQT